MLPRGRRRRSGATGDHIHTRLGSGQILLSNVECVRGLRPAWLRKLTAAHDTRGPAAARACGVHAAPNPVSKSK